MAPFFSYSFGPPSIQHCSGPTAASCWTGSADSYCDCCGLVCILATISTVSVVFEPAHVDFRPGMENRWFCVPRVVYLQHFAGRTRTACRLGRHRDRSDRTTSRVEARPFAVSEELHRMAAAWNYGSSLGSWPWRNSPAQPACDCDQCHDGASDERDPDLRRSVVHDPALDQHRPSSAVGGAAVSACWRATAIIRRVNRPGPQAAVFLCSK